MIQIGTSEAAGLAEWVNAGIALAALIGAIVSILLTFASVRSQDKHNKLSLRPLPRIGVGDYLDELYVKIMNDGPGPMIVKEVRISDGAIIEDNLLSFMSEIPDDFVWKDFVLETKGRSIRSNDEMILIAIQGDPNDADFIKVRTSIRQILKKLSVEVEFTDVYGSKLTPCKRVLTWFARP